MLTKLIYFSFDNEIADLWLQICDKTELCCGASDYLEIVVFLWIK
jgi:hypothetical protein